MDATQFFELSAGTWLSQRTVHHLAFRRVEMGASEIQVVSLPADHPTVVELCEFHQIDPQEAVGGAQISWHGTMDWDKDTANHSGSTAMVLVPDVDNPAQGRLLRERGYAEIVPAVGRFWIDSDGGFNLVTEYETMSAVERFSFPGPGLRMRTSTVKQFGGFSTASICTETRIATETESASPDDVQADGEVRSGQTASLLGW